MIFDTHAHYDDEKFDEDREALFASLQCNNIKYVVNVSATFSQIEKTIALAKKYDFVYGTVGVHPSEIEPLNDESLAWMKEKLSEEKIVAVGEIGLDYYWGPDKAAEQKEWFEKQLQMAIEADMPVIIHSRDAAKDTMDILKKKEYEKVEGIVHCFSYSKEIARECLDLGYYLGIGGVVTFKNAKKLREVVEYMPMDRLVLETDCPYLAPEPNRGKRNSSLNLPYVVEAIANIKGMTVKEVEDITFENAKKVYRLLDI